MDIRKTRFYHSGEIMNFTVFSDRLCRVHYLESIIRASMRQTPVEVYAIEPSANSQWVVVQERDWAKSHLHFFIRDGKAFPENRPRRFPRQLKKTILQQLPVSDWSRQQRWIA